MRNKYPYIIIILILVASIYLVIFSNNPQTESDNQATPSPTITQATKQYTASFLIFTNGTQRLFTSSMYHNLSPDVYIQQPNPSIIYVENSGITWKDFFSTLPMGLSPTCLITGTGQTFCTENNTSSTTAAKLTFILNGIENPDVLEEVIQPNDKLLISFGRSTDTQLRFQYDQIPSLETSPSAQLQKEE